MLRDNLYQATRPRVSNTIFLRLLSIHLERVRVQRHMYNHFGELNKTQPRRPIFQEIQSIIIVYRVCQCHVSRQRERTAPLLQSL